MAEASKALLATATSIGDQRKPVNHRVRPASDRGDARVAAPQSDPGAGRRQRRHGSLPHRAGDRYPPRDW